MSTPAQMGGYEWKAQINAASSTANDLRLVLGRLLREFPSPLLQALVGQAAMHLLELSTSLQRLDEIGRNTEKKKGNPA